MLLYLLVTVFYVRTVHNTSTSPAVCGLQTFESMPNLNALLDKIASGLKIMAHSRLNSKQTVKEFATEDKLGKIRQQL